MKITFLVGNGFDLNIGKKTSYRNFYNYYLRQPSKSDLIIKLKNNLKQNYENWSDLELGLGEYTKNIKDIDEFDFVLGDIIDNLSIFIKNQEIKYDFTENITNDYYSYLIYPERSLSRGDKESIELFKNKFGSLWNIDIITFNYSLSIEQILKYDDNEKQISNNPNVKLNSIKHIHGFSDRRMIIGVNDITQLGNENFKNNPDITGSIIKPEINKNIKDLVDEDCLKIITESSIICLFGISIGDTDKIWWESIGNRLLREINCILIIFFKGENIPINREYLIARKENEIKTMFKKKANITNEQYETLKNRIYVGYNTDLFKLDNKLKKIIENEIQTSLKIEDIAIN
jgi:hypothetical protein